MSGKSDKHEDYDDGRTIADMSSDWLPWNRGLFRRSKSQKKEERKKSVEKTDKRHFRDMVMGQYLAMLPVLLCILASFTLMFLLLRLWLKS